MVGVTFSADDDANNALSNLAKQEVVVEESSSLPIPPIPPPSSSSSSGLAAHIASINHNIEEDNNNIPTTTKTITTDMNDIIRKEYLEGVHVVFQAIKMLHGSSLPPRELQRMQISFDTHVSSVIERLQKRMNDIGEDDYRKHAEQIMAKHGLFDICFQEIINYLSNISPELVNILRKLRLVHTNLFQSFPPILLSLQRELKEESKKFEMDRQRADEETTQLLEAAEILERENENQKLKIISLSKRCKELKKENENLKLNHISRGTTRTARGKSSTYQGLHHMNMNMNMNNKDNHNNNKNSHNHNRTNSTASNRSLKSNSSMIKSPLSEKFVSTSMLTALANDTITNNNHNNNNNNHHHQGESAGNNTGSNGEDNNNNNNNKLPSVRPLTLNQLKEFIDLIYKSKEAADKKCIEMKCPRETMEQHMYTFLNQRYGLRHLIIENASAILKATTKYTNMDNGVAVFGRIIRNEIEEETRYVQENIKEAVTDLLRVHIKGKNTLKMDEFINDILSEKCDNDILEEEWLDIVQYLYNQEDSLALTLMIRDFVTQHVEPKDFNNTTSGTKGKSRSEKRPVLKPKNSLPYKDFLKILQDFQLHGHYQFLCPFRDEFRRVDSDGNGVINENEFRILISVIAPHKYQDEVEELLEKLDPYYHQKITFSDTVQCLSQEILDMSDGTNLDVFNTNGRSMMTHGSPERMNKNNHSIGLDSEIDLNDMLQVAVS